MAHSQARFPDYPNNNYVAHNITVPPSQANVWVSVNEDLEIHDVSEPLVNKRHDALKYHNISPIHRRLTKFHKINIRYISKM